MKTPARGSEKHAYPLDAWLEDFGNSCEVLLAERWLSGDTIAAYFRTVYPNPDELGEWKRERMSRAFAYLLEHDAALEKAGLISMGPGKVENTVEHQLVHALYLFLVEWHAAAEDRLLLESVISTAKKL